MVEVEANEDSGIWIWPALHFMLWPSVRDEKSGHVKRIAFRFYLTWLWFSAEKGLDFRAPLFLRGIFGPMRPLPKGSAG